MLSKLDDYPVHQTVLPLAVPDTSDRHSYDRYWFNGYDRDGEFYFGIAMCRYPNLGILDCAFSIVRGGEQHSFHGSRRMPLEPTDLTVGPFELQILEPMGRTRLVLDDNETGIAADLTLTPRTAAVEEGRQTLVRDDRVVLDSTRFAQFGHWEGEIAYADETLKVEAASTPGTKDRSWGVRPVGDPAPPGAPSLNFTGIFFLWAPIHWEDRCTHFLVFEEPDGRPWHIDAMIVPVHDGSVPPVVDPDVQIVPGATHELVYEPGTRRMKEGRLALVDHDGSRFDIDIEPLICFRMKGIGYTHAVWGHGMWKGDLAI
ncbi:MAG TPA: hypothetical protein VID94_18735, partial [Acidimicrobiales bacterium]